MKERGEKRKGNREREGTQVEKEKRLKEKR